MFATLNQKMIHKKYLHFFADSAGSEYVKILKGKFYFFV
jgi:hypothetical protein